MTVTRHDDGSVTLVCECPEGADGPACGFEQTYDSEDAAFEDGWDGVGVVASWPPTCPICPGVAALGLANHARAHARWEREGRPEEFSAADIVPVSEDEQSPPDADRCVVLVCGVLADTPEGSRGEHQGPCEDCGVEITWGATSYGAASTHAHRDGGRVSLLCPACAGAVAGGAKGIVAPAVRERMTEITGMSRAEIDRLSDRIEQMPMVELAPASIPAVNTREGPIALLDQSDYLGTYTDHQAPGGIENGKRFRKTRNDDRDAHPAGAEGVVIGSIWAPEDFEAEYGIEFAYWVAFDGDPEYAVAIADNAIEELP